MFGICLYNVAGGEHPGLNDLDIDPALIESVLPIYLGRYRRAGERAGAVT